ncbi:MAG: DNA mismatch repair protein MutS [Thermodesulfobacteriota bacterium]|nr:DNA mismatch repair protein MutS [Thermodesulfobacteriota bacterium]
MSVQKNTPMMAQYFSIKEKYKDAILFYRMGDFYEMFHKDAEKASAILEIALTSRNKNQEDPIPMCGVPYKAADAYIARLIENGCKVAVCEQMEDPSAAKGLMKREVVRVITPGMILNETLLDKNANNFLVALSLEKNRSGLAFLDISTGLFQTTETETENGRLSSSIIDEALKLDPSEILLPSFFEKDPEFNPLKKRFSNKQITYLEKNAFRLSESKNRLIEKFNTRSLEGFGCEALSAGICAAGAIMCYVEETQLQTTAHISSLKPYDLKNYLIIDDKSCRNLELLKNLQSRDKKGALISILDKTVTAMGARLLKHWIRYPLIDRQEIEKRLFAVEEAKDNPLLRKNIQDYLKKVYDLERLGSRISMGQGNARDLVFLKHSLFQLPGLLNELNRFTSPLLTGEDMAGINDTGQELAALAELIHKAVREDAPPALNDGGLINKGYNETLDEILEISKNGKKWIAQAGIKEKEKTGLSSLKIKFNKVFGYFIEVSKNQAKSVPDTYIRKQTLVNAERFITEDLKEVESRILNAHDKRIALEYEIFCQVRDRVVEKTASILKMAGFLARTDTLLSLGEAADENNYSKPVFNTDQVINIKEGRHPVVEKMIAGERYVPNSITMDNETTQVLIITGPNMAGKSTVLRQVALTILMAQMGGFVPSENASLCIVDRIFTRVGALDNVAMGQSTFMVEMEETARIVNNSTENSLVILDEIGRGTSTFDGMSIAWAVADYLHNLNGRGVKTLFATHYHELTRLAEMLPRVENFNIAVKEFRDNIVFLRKLVKGGTNKSYGIQVARLAGLPDTIIAKAKEILEIVEKQGRTKEEADLNQSDKPACEQMDLFCDHRNNNDRIADMVAKIDISSTTPVQALNLLNEFQEMISAGTS